MPNTVQIPKATKHQTGQAVVRLNGKDYYLGRHGSAQAQAKYQELISQWLAGGRILPNRDCEPSLNELLLAYDKHAETYYASVDKKSTEHACLRDALLIVKQMFGRTPARDFGPKKLKNVRQAMIAKNWCRTYVNHQIDRVRRMFRWAVSEEMVPGDIYHALQAVPGLRRGMPGIRESKPVKPVPEYRIACTLVFMPRPVQAMVQLQLLTGMRPGEVTTMRTVDVDMTGRVWIYRPPTHKNSHHGHERQIYLGPKAQEIVRPWLSLQTTAFIFCPAQAERERNAERRRQRKSPMTPSQSRRKSERRSRAPSDHYDVASYRRAIMRACERAFALPEHIERQVQPNGRLESRKSWLARLTAR
jgi:integrase